MSIFSWLLVNRKTFFLTLRYLFRNVSATRLALINAKPQQIYGKTALSSHSLRQTLISTNVNLASKCLILEIFSNILALLTFE